MPAEESLRSEAPNDSEGSKVGKGDGSHASKDGKDAAEPKAAKGGYKRIKVLGQGSFGKAFLAQDLSHNDLCVMKQVSVDKMDAKERDTAVREAVALRRVRHPNVVRFRQVFLRSGWLCLVMDFADGGDLSDAVKARAKAKVPFEESSVLECFSQVADAVHYVHGLKMVHRDIKSRNVFLCQTGRALLGDFGLVRLLETTCELAHTRVGTPYYLSPEIIRRQAYNYKTDIWSLGVLLYEIASLKKPFAGTLETLPKAIVSGTYEPLGSRWSEPLCATVAGFLQVDPAQRLDLAAALQQEVLREPLQRVREALNLEEPQAVESPKPTGSEHARRPTSATKPQASAKPEALQARASQEAKAETRGAEAHPRDQGESVGYATLVRKAAACAPKGCDAPTPAAPAADFANVSIRGTSKLDWSMLGQKGDDSDREEPHAD